MEMRLRVIDGGVDKYGLNAYIYDSKRRRQDKYDRVLFSFTKDGDDKVANLKEGQWADVKVTINGTRTADRPAQRQDRGDAHQGRAARRATSRRCGCSTRR